MAKITIPYAVSDFVEMRERGFYYVVQTKILQKSGIQKNEVIELIYRGFI